MVGAYKVDLMADLESWSYYADSALKFQVNDGMSYEILVTDWPAQAKDISEATAMLFVRTSRQVSGGRDFKRETLANGVTAGQCAEMAKRHYEGRRKEE